MGLFDTLMNALMQYAIKKDLHKDPEFKQNLDKYTKELKRLSDEAEQVFKKSQDIIAQGQGKK